MAKWGKKLLGLAAAGGAIAGLVYYFKKKDTNEDDDFEDDFDLDEKLVAELLKVEKLPASGKNCIRFNQDGDIVATNNGNVSKSADFYINGVYYTQKYTHESGGAQDNQYNDVRDFLIKGSKKYKVGAIVDGAYWNNKRLQLQQMFKDNPNVVITTVDELLKEI